jgi:2-phospho-L-lactate guanylyltransferase
VSTWALVPARTFLTAKSRLRTHHRAAIARALFDRVAGVVSTAPGIAGLLVCTDGVDVARAARKHGAEVLYDDGPQLLAAVVDRGLAHLAARGAQTAVVVMADLPLLGPRHVEDLLAGLRVADVALAPDRDQLGTNALAVRLPAPLATRFGHADSFRRHLAAAIDLRVIAVRTHGLAFDIDAPADLEELVSAAPAPVAEPSVAGQRFVRTERRRRITDTVERIARIVHAPV